MSGKNVTEVVLADAEGIAKAARILESGGLVAVPTETVYGLAARADSAEAVAKIYAAKGRPDFNPLIVHVRDVEQAGCYAEWPSDADLAAMIHWPGPLTLVLPKKDDAALTEAVTAGLPTVALRCPAHPVMQALLAAVDFPLAAPSANRSGFISPTTAQHVLASLDGRIDMVLDAGPTSAGVESTILAIGRDGSWRELRPGPVDSDALHRHYFDYGISERQAGVQAPARIEAPGQLASHYAPGKPVRLGATEAEPDEFLIGFGAVQGDCTLSASGDVNEAATRLYACLHEAARADHPRIAVAPVPDQGVGRAINDRLRRAATPAD
ncbi:L-threonylcarbamoyladenylate synthase [Erythrobacter sp. sf7]|uniref:Threonylcarbamoyl-AMP synthase n=1 Tax=Erythrobacter fulvus TaxID=2987523 RepID=A0ABT5JMH4_9SPHN|nr:L-threonylcarbamoyladenylate synthase [Erythrobacter fulvus]MDC8753726.1 L-threonylcarbamoyladenylate synthase [Erythrobacter fulvus]